MQNTCCFTGHRYGGLPWGSDEKDVRCIILKELLRLKIERLIREENTECFISGMTQGVDIYAAEIVLEMREEYGVSLECALPWEEQSASWKEGERARHKRIIRQADKVTLVSKDFSTDCYYKRNLYMVDRSSIVLAVWNGNPSGTAITIRYAREKKKKIIIINPATFKMYDDFRAGSYMQI